MNEQNLAALLKLFPEFDPRWDPAVQIVWFQTFDKLLAALIKENNVTS